MPAKELAAVGSLFANDQGSLHQIAIVHNQRPTLTTCDILRFVEALGRQASKGSGVLAFVTSKEGVRIVFYNRDVIEFCCCTDGIHLTGDAGVVHGDNRLCARGDERFEPGLIQVQSVGTDVRKHDLRATQDKRVGGRNKRK